MKLYYILYHSLFNLSIINPFSDPAGFTFNASDAANTQLNNTTYYYYVVVIEADGDRAVSAPIWYNRNDLILPVSLLSFNAYYDNRNRLAAVNWSTTQEINSKSFIIERSGNGIHFTTVGTVAAAGNSQALRQYQYNDIQPLSGTSYYRLRQVDVDGKETLSRIVKVTTDGKVAYTVTPNPAKWVTYL